MKDMFNKFIKNVKEYAKYLMQVDFRDLFINTIIIFCIMILACFVYVPIGIIKDLIRSFITIYFVFQGNSALLFNWVFNLISAICCFIAFMYLFNLRFEDLKKFKNQIAKDKKSSDKETSSKVEKNKEEEEDLELPKTKA